LFSGPLVRRLVLGAVIAASPLAVRAAWFGTADAPSVLCTVLAFALEEKAPSDAVDRLQAALPYDLAMPGTAFFAKFGGLYPAYVRGLAYLEAGRGWEAAAEFQKVLDHRGIVLADPIGALAYLQLGRALAVLGETDRAIRAYQDFLAAWKHTDSDIPLLKQARAEYGKL